MRCRFVLLLILTTVASVLSQPREHVWAGANQYQLWYQPEHRIRQQLDAMQDAGLHVLRVFLGVRPFDYPWEDPSPAYSFEPQLGVYNDELLERVDYLMAECKKRGILMIIALENANFNAPYEAGFGILGQYTHPSAMQAFKQRFSYFLNHHNAILGKAWKDLDSVVLAWEISNEPGIKLDQIESITREEKTVVLRNWLGEMASHLKSIDPDTYVSLGITGYDRYYNKGIGDDIIELGNIEDADIYTLHYYGGNLAGWFEDVQETLRSWGKLLILEEFGVERQVGDAQTLATYKQVTSTCYEYGVPWMFWRLGHRKDETTWSIMHDDPVWQDVVAPQAEKINRKLTEDNWNVYKLRNAAMDVWEDFELEQPRYWTCWESTAPFTDDAILCELSTIQKTEGYSSLWMQFDPQASSKDVATVFPSRMSPYDWELIDGFTVDVYNASDEIVQIQVLLTVGPDRQQVFLEPVNVRSLQPGWNRALLFDVSHVDHRDWIAELVFRILGYSKPGTVYFDAIRLQSDLKTAVDVRFNPDSDEPGPTGFTLSPAYPNPFKESSVIRISDLSERNLQIDVYNLLGKHVLSRSLRREGEIAEFRWRGQNELGRRVPPGMYLIRVQSGRVTQMAKMMFFGDG